MQLKQTANFADAPELLREFLYYMLTIRGRSPRTVNGYYIDLRTFLRFIKLSRGLAADAESFEEIGIADVDAALLRSITLSDVYDFLNYALTERSNNPNTRARKVSCLRSFFKYLTAKAGVLQENPVKDLELPSIRKSLPKHLSLEESIELVARVNSRYPRRDYCILTLLLNCGMRLSELVGIDLQDIRDNTLRLLGKGNKERIVYLNEACLFAIDQYRAERAGMPHAAREHALLLSARGTRLTPRRVEQIVADCLKAAGLEGKGYSPHKLRHTAATLMYQHGGVDIRVLKELLGHENLATTEIYTHVSNAQIEKAAQSSPLATVMIKKSRQQKDNPED